MLSPEGLDISAAFRLVRDRDREVGVFGAEIVEAGSVAEDVRVWETETLGVCRGTVSTREDDALEDSPFCCGGSVPGSFSRGAVNGFGASGITWDTDGLLACTEALGGEGLLDQDC